MVGNATENTYQDDSLLSKLDQALTKIEDLLAFIGALVILGLMIAGTFNAIGRKFFDTPVWGYIDLVGLFMVAFSFLAIAAMQRVGGHIRMELLVRRLSGRTLWAVELIGVLVALSIMFVLIYYSSTALVRSIELGDTTIDREITIWPSKMWVPIAFGVLIARLVLQTWGYLRLVANPDLTPIAVPLMHSEAELADKEIHDTFGDDETEVHALKD
jgi:TRAP-type mannitol/chloroaromatic compound transport system permease small subunit